MILQRKIQVVNERKNLDFYIFEYQRFLFFQNLILRVLKEAYATADLPNLCKRDWVAYFVL